MHCVIGPMSSTECSTVSCPVVGRGLQLLERVPVQELELSLPELFPVPIVESDTSAFPYCVNLKLEQLQNTRTIGHDLKLFNHIVTDLSIHYTSYKCMEQLT